MSYEEFYGFSEQPFSNAPDARFFFKSEQHEEAMKRLFYCIDTRKGLAVLVGPIGNGKTILARTMLEQLHTEEYEAALLVIVHAGISADWLLRKIALQMGISDPPNDKLEILSLLNERLVELNEQGKKPVVLIDEAQMLNNRAIMEEFRGLLNLEGPGHKMISLILFGLPELDDCLKLDEPLKQRVAVHYNLASLKLDMTEKYLQHRLSVVGCEDDIFSSDAITEIHHFSKGVPRLINTIADNALFESYLLKKKTIDSAFIREIGVGLGLDKS